MSILIVRRISKIIIACTLIVVFTGLTTSCTPIKNYKLRGKVNDALAQTILVRLDIIDYYREKKVFPKSNADIGKDNPLILESGDEVVVNENGFTLYLRSGEQELSGKSVEFRPVEEENQIEWDCTGGTLIDSLRPSMCRSETYE